MPAAAAAASNVPPKAPGAGIHASKKPPAPAPAASKRSASPAGLTRKPSFSGSIESSFLRAPSKGSAGAAAVPAPSPAERFAEAVRQAQALATRVGAASAEAMRRLHGDEFKEAFALQGAAAFAEAAEASAKGSCRVVAQAIAEGARQDAIARDLSSAITSVMAELALRPVDGPVLLVETVQQRLQANHVLTSGQVASAQGLIKAMEVEGSKWDPEGSKCKIISARAAMLSLIQASAERMEQDQAVSTERWKAAQDQVQKKRKEFEKLGQPDKVACVISLAEQMDTGLRGLMVQRAIRAAAGGILELRRCGEDHGVMNAATPAAALHIIGNRRADAQRRLEGLAEVVQREAEDAQHWAVRGKLPDGAVPKAVLNDDVVGDMWGELLPQEAMQLLLAKLGAPQTAGNTPEDRLLAALARLDALKAVVGDSQAALTSDSAHSDVTLAIANGAPHSLPDSVRRAVDALGSAIATLDGFCEGLLEILDEEPRAIPTACGRWNQQWLTPEISELARVNVELAAACPQVAVIVLHNKGIIEPTLASNTGCRTLVHTMRAIAELGGESGADFRSQILSLR